MSYYITIDKFQIDPRYVDEQIVLGDGVNMSDPRSPAKSIYSVFKAEEKEAARTKEPEIGNPISPNNITELFSIHEYSKVQDESNTLSQYFKASYGFASVGQSLKIATEQRNENHTIYALLEHGGEVRTLKSDDINWGKLNPESAMIGDLKKDQDLFLKRYGSHFVSSIKYGLRIGIQGKLQKSDRTKSTDVSVDFKAAFGQGSAGAGVRNVHVNKLNAMGVEILLEATSGGRKDGGMCAITDIGQINSFLDDIEAAKIQFAVAPIQVTLKTYKPTLRREWENTRKLFERQDPELPLAKYGVPKGTVIPWYPPIESVQGLESEEVTINPPEGWAICNGLAGTPNLTNYFIRGTDEFSNIGQSGGAENHLHNCAGNTGVTKNFAHCGGGKEHKLPYETHTHTVNINTTENNHLPPFVWLVYIMKL